MKLTAPLKEFLKTSLPWPAFWRLKRFWEEWNVFFSAKDLTSLGRIYKTDKVRAHFYTPVYEHWFRSLRYKPVRLLEIGVGGYDKLNIGGNSLRMWKSYFPQGLITGIDIYDKSSLALPRIKIYQGDQSDAAFLQQVSSNEGPFDIIIDDGSHIQSHIIASFETLFPLLKSGGIYVIEDTQTSYWPTYEGSSNEMYTVASSMNYFIKRIHDLNHKEWKEVDRRVNEIGLMIETICFYHNLIIIVKNNGVNN